MLRRILAVSLAVSCGCRCLNRSAVAEPEAIYVMPQVATTYVPSYQYGAPMPYFESNYEICKPHWTVSGSLVPETKTSEVRVEAPDATNAGDVLLAAEIIGVQGVNPQKLATVLQSALASGTINLGAHTVEILADRVAITTTRRAIDNVNYTHRIIAQILPATGGKPDEVALRVYSLPETGGAAPENVPQEIFTNLVSVIRPEEK